MGEPITTRRAIEVVMSRVPMQPGTARDLGMRLSHEIETGRYTATPRDAEALVAAIHVALETLTGVSDFPRAGLLARISIARDVLRAAADQREGGRDG